jgi:cytidylate kinase
VLLPYCNGWSRYWYSCFSACPSLKFFITADPKVRAERRFKELAPKNPDFTLEQVFESLAHRDYQDTTRAESPLVRADDAIILDNTKLTPDEQLQFVLDKLPESEAGKIHKKNSN